MESVPKIATHSSKDGWEKYTECPLNIKRSLKSLNLILPGIIISDVDQSKDKLTINPKMPNNTNIVVNIQCTQPSETKRNTGLVN